MRIESNLRRLDGVRSVRSSLAAGVVTVQWRPGITLDLPRLKEAVLRWRGGVRYGGAVITVIGVIDEPEGDGAAPASLPLRAVGTGQRFRLQGKGGSADLSPLLHGEPVRITGRVIKEREGKDHEIWLELEREPNSR
jgi:hypothetical protein